MRDEYQMQVMEEQRTMPVIVAVTGLGPNNKGAIGPEDIPTDTRERLQQDVARPEYVRRATRRFRCVDGRLCESGTQHMEDEADPQIAGGMAITDTVVQYMVAQDPEPLAQLVATTTRAAVADGYPVVVHGDAHAGKAGCGANKNLREILRSNTANVDIVAPVAWSLTQQLGIDAWLEPEDASRLIVSGSLQANNDALWNATPEQVTDIIIANGGTYEELAGDHNEKLLRVDTTPDSFDEAGFMTDHDGIQAFNASLGAYKNATFERTLRRGGTEHEAAREVLAGIIWHIGVAKQLGSPELPAVIVAPAVV